MSYEKIVIPSDGEPITISEKGKLKVPNNPISILNILYGRNWNDVCKSGTWVHKTEQSKIERTLPCKIIEKYN